MKKGCFLVAAVALAALVAFLFAISTAKHFKASIDYANENGDRFSYVSVDDKITIITDSKTGREYIFFKDGYGGGLCELEEDDAGM